MHIALVSFGIMRKRYKDADDSVAFDDQTSTFIIPSGGGFGVVFCPPGRSSTILATMAAQLLQLAQTGHVTAQLIADTQNITIIRKKSLGFVSATKSQGLVLALAMTGALFLSR